MNKIKEMLLKFVKPLVLAHLADLGMLMPHLAKVLVEKSHMSQEQADALAKDLLSVIETELRIMIEKL